MFTQCRLTVSVFLCVVPRGCKLLLSYLIALASYIRKTLLSVDIEMVWITDKGMHSESIVCVQRCYPISWLHSWFSVMAVWFRGSQTGLSMCLQL
jgi:hypothetical protein